MKPFLCLAMGYLTLFCSCVNISGSEERSSDDDSLQNATLQLQETLLPDSTQFQVMAFDIAKNLSDSDIITVGNFSPVESFESISLEVISENEFLKYRKTRKEKLIHPVIHQTDSLFFLNTAGGSYSFRKKPKMREEGMENSWYEYLGYMPELMLHYYVSHYNSSEYSFGELRFLDSLTGKVYTIPSNDDGAVTDVILSPDNNYLAYFSNNILQQCFIGVLKVNDRNGQKYLSEFGLYQADRTIIEDLVWIDDTAFVIKVKYSHHSPERSYFRSGRMK